ncbi:Mediator of RNA polymerase II transcription subunit 23 [Apostasia shenzhenica]|uniref:Mediator of RNA polymerase II transcription subunit 23 n=1 Tax=Apostasia shenzhenica TaxID=1088818 RepID=A0A2I0B4M9_9ASPA|nr:Mediator of RNA polymerase II transcription subunit 23 [Apostasia shenzhenica]
MEQSQRASRHVQLHCGRSAVVDLFNLYLGRNSRQKSDDLPLPREASNKMQKRVTAPIGDLPPRNEQFLLDFEQLQVQFQDREQLRTLTESVLIAFVIQCSAHVPQSEFLLFAMRSLCSVGYVKWDSFLPSLLSTISSAEGSFGSGCPTMIGNSSAVISPSITVPNASSSHISNPASPLPLMHGIGSPTQSITDQSSAPTLSPVKPSELVGTNQLLNMTKLNLSVRSTTISYLRQLACKVILNALESNLKPVTHAEIFSHMINWLVNWGQRNSGIDESETAKPWKPERPLLEWMHSCLDVIWKLVDEDKCLVPFYELIRSGLQYLDNIPDDEAFFSIILEIHRRRDMVATHMQMLDQHLHCPSFGTHRFLSQTYANPPGEPIANLRYSPITYPSVLGEPLHGEELAFSIHKGSLDWERALRCLRHALHTTPSPDWWRRVLLVAPCYRQQAQPPTPGAVFSPEMNCEAVIDRTIDLLKLTNSEVQCWQDWLVFADIFFFLMKSGCIDFLDFVNKLASRVASGDQHILRSNHVTWLLAQIIRIEIVMNTLSSDPKKVETTRKIISFHKEDKNPDSSNVSPQSILLDFISSSQTLRIWSFNSSIREYLNSDQLQKGKQIDEWWKQVTKGERMMDFMNIDDRSMGMFWVLSYTMAQPACEAVMNWLNSSGVTEILQGPNVQSNDRMMMMRETYPLSMSLLSGLSINLCLKLVYQLEDAIFLGQVIPSIAMVETYVRLLLIAPHSLFRPHFTTLTQRSPSILSKPGVSLLLLEILNYRLLPLYRYHGKNKALMYDVTKIISMIKGKRGEHRLFRLAENLCMNLILSIRDFFLVKKELKGPTEFTETLNRMTIISLAITIKTRGIAEVEHMLYLQQLLDQIMSTSQHTWSEKTLRYFPPLIRIPLNQRMDKRGEAIQAWQQAETTVINQCNQLLSPSADPNYVLTYLSHSFPQHRQYVCAGAWVLMNGLPESINSAHLGRILREFSPEEVTSNIYTMVDVLLHHIQLELQRGHVAQELLSKAISGLAFFIWTHELLPLDILLLALIDRDDDPYALRIVIGLLDRPELQQRIKMFCSSRISPEHWLNNQPPKRVELQKALGNHLLWKDRYPPFFDDIAARIIPVIPLIIYRLIENDAPDIAERVLALYSSLLIFHPLRFTFVRDILAYFYGHLPSKLIVRILKVLDISKVITIALVVDLNFDIFYFVVYFVVLTRHYSSDSLIRVLSSVCFFKSTYLSTAGLLCYSSIRPGE